MIVPEKIWKDPALETVDKLIIGKLLEDPSAAPEDVAKELQCTRKLINQRMNKLSKSGRIVVITTQGVTRREVQHG